MQAVMLVALVLGAAQPPQRTARALPCGPRFVPVAMRLAAPAPRAGERPAPARRSDAPRRGPCFRLAAA